MVSKRSRASGIGLERLCTKPAADWMRSTDAVHGVELLAAWFQGHAYHTHRHDTYAIGLTVSGVQAFDYRGAAEISTPGKVVVLHPDERHDGHAGTEEGFGYRIDIAYCSVTIGRHSLEQRFRRGFHVAVQHNFTVVIHDTDVHAPGMQVDTAVKGVLMGVESPVKSPL